MDLCGLSRGNLASQKNITLSERKVGYMEKDLNMGMEADGQKHSVPLRSIIKEFSLEEIFVPENIEDI